MNQLKESLLKRICHALVMIALLAVVLSGVPSTSQAAITEQEAHAIGVDAYLYFYSLITMDVTRKQLTNVEPGKASIGGPMNMFDQRPDISDCRHEGGRATQLRYAVFHLRGSISQRSR